MTQRDLDDDKKSECDCRKGCSTLSYSCLKFGILWIYMNMSKYVQSTGLRLWFRLQTRAAHPNFVDWLIENAQNDDELQAINCKDSQEIIMRCWRFNEIILFSSLLSFRMFSYENVFFDEQELIYMQKYCWMMHSFCSYNICQDNREWHWEKYNH